MRSFRQAWSQWGGLIIALASAAAILGVGLSCFGIWDPYESYVAEAARLKMQGKPAEPVQGLRSGLIGWAFSLVGVREWTGRLVLVIAALLCLWAAFVLVKRIEGKQAGIATLWVLLSTPLFLLHSRQMFGESLSFLVQTLVGLSAAALIFGSDNTKPIRGVRPYLWLGALTFSIALAMATRGALLGVLPVLLAASLAGCFWGNWKTASVQDAVGMYAVWALTLLLTVMTVLGVLQDSASYSVWVGGSAQGVQPPSFDKVVEHLFHGFAPWSALFPAGVAWIMLGKQPETLSQEQDDRHKAFRLMLVLWVALSFAAQLLYESRYGSAVFLAVVPSAALIGIYLEEIAKGAKRSLVIGLFSALLVGLILRDFALFSVTPLGALGIDQLELPDSMRVRLPWAVVFGLFALMILYVFASPEKAVRPDMKAPYRKLQEQWRRSFPHKVWLSLFALIFVAGLLLTGVAFIERMLPFQFTVLSIKIFHVLAVLPACLVLLVLAIQWGGWFFAKLGARRTWPLLGAGLMVGMYLSHGFVPLVSAHFSQKDVYTTFATLAKAREPLAEYHVGTRSASYYTDVPIRSLEQQSEVTSYLVAPERAWLVFPADQLAVIDRMYRKQSHRHLFIPHASNGKVLLATNQTISAEVNHNPLSSTVRSTPPPMEHKVGVKFGDKIELLGYTLELPHEGYVGAGEKFKIRWVFNVLDTTPGAYAIFLHVDGHGQRLNGDHEPVNELYPVRYWDKGDIIVDEQSLVVPINFRPGQYAMFIGFYSGGTRLSVQGTADNRCQAGNLTVR